MILDDRVVACRSIEPFFRPRTVTSVYGAWNRGTPSSWGGSPGRCRSGSGVGPQGLRRRFDSSRRLRCEDAFVGWAAPPAGLLVAGSSRWRDPSKAYPPEPLVRQHGRTTTGRMPK